jgi:hypothetical protein
MIVAVLPVLAVEVALIDEPSPGGPGGGSHARSNDCTGTIIWDTGMYDDFIPPTGCSSSASAGCFVNAINEGGFPVDWRRLADDWISDAVGSPITGIKIWGRYNQAGYDYYLANPGSLHGFCVKFYQPYTDPPWCPDGTVPGEEAIGTIVYEQYVPMSDVSEYLTPPPALARSYNYCMTLTTPFFPNVTSPYWVSVSADFDFTAAATQWFWRLYGGGIGFDPYCESMWKNDTANWIATSIGTSLPCWSGWEQSFVLYSDYTPPTGACCTPAGDCTLTTEAGCPPPNVWHGEWTSCADNPCPQLRVCCVGQECFVVYAEDCALMGGVFHPEWNTCGPPNPCAATPSGPDTWGGVKNMYR